MMQIIIGVGVVLVLVILFMIFRIGSLVGLVKEEKAKVGPLNRINAFLFIAFMPLSLVLFFWYSFVHFKSYTLPVASEHGKVTDVGPGCRLEAPAGWLHRNLAGPPYRIVLGTNLPGDQWTRPVNKDPAERPASLMV